MADLSRSIGMRPYVAQASQRLALTIPAAHRPCLTAHSARQGLHNTRQKFLLTKQRRIYRIHSYRSHSGWD